MQPNGSGKSLRKCNRIHSFGRIKDGIWCQQLDNQPQRFLASSFEVAAAFCRCNPLTGHDNTMPSIHHIRGKEDRGSEIIHRKVIEISHREHTTSHLWPRNIRPPAICFHWRGQITAIRLQNFRILRPSRLKHLSFPGLFRVSSTLTIIWFLCVQEAATTAPWPTHCMKVAWMVQIWLCSRIKIQIIGNLRKRRSEI